MRKNNHLIKLQMEAYAKTITRIPEGKVNNYALFCNGFKTGHNVARKSNKTPKLDQEQRYKILLGVYNKLKSVNEKTQQRMAEMRKLLPSTKTYNGGLISIRKKGLIYYIELSNIPVKNCYVCGENKPTAAHHLVPKRAKCKNPALKELRIRVCKECDTKIHIENQLMRLLAQFIETGNDEGIAENISPSMLPPKEEHITNEEHITLIKNNLQKSGG